MTLNEQMEIARSNHAKMEDTVGLVRASILKLKPYDETKVYDADELEPYDALSDRFIRAVEIGIKFFRSYEMLEFAEQSDTLRNLLNRMEKLGVVSSVEIWFRMRDVRNRIVHDYLPQEVKDMYGDIMGDFSDELNRCVEKSREAI